MEEVKIVIFFAVWKKPGGWDSESLPDVPGLWHLSLSSSTAPFQRLGLRNNLPVESLEVGTNACVGINNHCVLLGRQEDDHDNGFDQRYCQLPGPVSK